MSANWRITINHGEDEHEILAGGSDLPGLLREVERQVGRMAGLAVEETD